MYKLSSNLALLRLALGPVIPPLVFEFGEVAVLFQMQNGEIESSAKRRLERRRHAVALGVQIPSHLHRVARLPLVDVVVLGRLDQKRIFAFRLPNSPDSFGIGIHKNVLFACHELEDKISVIRNLILFVIYCYLPPTSSRKQ